MIFGRMGSLVSLWVLEVDLSLIFGIMGLEFL